MKNLPIYPYCFICGDKNIAGTNVVFKTTPEGGVQCEYIAKEQHNSYQGILHGGIISALLDECIGWSIAVKEKKMFMTGELNIQFKRHIPINTKVIVKGNYQQDTADPNKRILMATGHIEDTEGKICAKAVGKYVAMNEEFSNKILDTLKLVDDPEREVKFSDLWEC